MVVENRRVPKSAILAGAVLAAPFAAHAGSIDFGPITVTSGGSPNSLSVDLLGNGDLEYTFTASLTSHDVTITPLSDANVSNAMYAGDNNFFCNGCLSEAIPFASGSAAASLLNPFISTPGGFLQKTGGSGGAVKGPWPNDGSFRYLGVSFTDRGTNYLGWIQLSAQVCDPSCPVSNTTSQVAATQVATNPFASFTLVSGDIEAATPEPSSIALLAMGAAGLAALRARRKNAA